MLTITLPDGAQRHYENALTVAALAQDISPSLAKIALAGTVNGTQVDTSFEITEDSTVGIITDKMPEGLEILRHSTAHLLAHAVKELYPSAQVTIGPVIDNGFYYDFAYERPFTPDDLAKIEARMKEIAARAIPVSRSLWGRDEAVAFFKNQGEHYKAEIISAIPENQNISLYQQENFTDLCRGPHVPNTKHLKVFKLMKVAGAYWRGDSKNAMLTRVYGTAWAKKDEQDAYLHRLAEAEKRDHRRIGKQLGWFHMQDDAPGMVFWHPKGWQLWQAVEQYMRGIFQTNGYQEIKTPMVVDRVLWEKSGHWENYGDLMFTTQSEKRDYAIKPMNCPCHVQIYNQGIKSYRDLPLRLAEFGSCHRNEFTGALHGLMRVRAFTQDDAHIFCTENQIGDEARDFIKLVFKVYEDFGFNNVLVKLSTRPEKRVGSDDVWDRAEQALADALTANGIDYELQPGEGAFYGPKIEFTLKDCLDRLWQCGTLQLDFNLPDRLDAEYIGEDNQRHRPVMLHRAILGSLERFIGILIEHHAGKMPLWLAPNQITVCTITERQNQYASEIKKQLDQSGLRAELDIRNEKVGYKIREHTLAKVPYLVILGDKEAENGQVAVRRGNEDVGVMTLTDFIARVQGDVAARA